jgi:cold shock CspA family protein
VQQTNIAKADEGELEPATVVFWNGRFGFARVDRGGQVYLGAAELVRAGITRVETGQRIRFEVRKASHKRKPWAANIRVLTHA